MNELLRNLNLEDVIANFEAEKIDIDMVKSLTDSELSRLGLSTIGDRKRIRDYCHRSNNNSQQQQQQQTIISTSNSNTSSRSNVGNVVSLNLLRSTPSARSSVNERSEI